MTTSFSRTIRSLDDNRVNPLIAWLLVLLVIWLLWSSWLVWGRIPVFASAEIDEITTSGLVQVTLPTDQQGVVRPGQEAVIQLTAGECVNGVVYDVEQSAENAPLTVTILPRDPLPNSDTLDGNITIQTARLAPLRLLLITLQSR